MILNLSACAKPSKIFVVCFIHLSFQVQKWYSL